MKRKAEDGSEGKKKKRKSEAAATAAAAANAAAAASAAAAAAGGEPLLNGGVLEEWMIVDWLKVTPNAKTQDCIAHFRPYLATKKQQQQFTTMVKSLAALKGGVLVLRGSYRDSVGAPSPPPGEAPSPAAS